MSATLVTYTISFGSLGATLPPRKKNEPDYNTDHDHSADGNTGDCENLFLVIKSVLSSAQNTGADSLMVLLYR